MAEPILKDSWITEGTIDFEYQKYILLAYLQSVNGKFDDKALYPFLSDLIFHFRNLERLKDQKKSIQSSFPKAITNLDIQQLRIEFESIMNDDSYIEEIEKIIAFALPKFEETIHFGASIYDSIEDQLEFEAIGIEPLYKELGYLFLRSGASKQAEAYSYAVSIYTNGDASYRSIRTKFLQQYELNFIKTYEQLKLDLIQTNDKLPNPAVYAFESKVNIPVPATLLPMAKRKLAQYIC